MIDFLAPEMLPYSVALMIFAIIAFLEFVSLLLGWAIFGFLDDIIITNHSDIHIESTGLVSGFFGYINPQKVPFSMVLVSLFFIFAFIGTLLQNIFGLLPLIITLPIVTFLTFILLRHLTNIIAKILPNETTEVVSTDSFLGKTAVILDPKAQRGLPARAKTRDVYGSDHYIRVEPLEEKETLIEGEEVIVMQKVKSVFYVEKRLEIKH
ncbi:MAG: DUF1449 family protein [Campylobacterota bacterium]|nr:DUF1449 family protein [Campylobacterota bacterium]